MCILFFFILYYCEHGGVDLIGLKSNTEDPIFLQCFDTVGRVMWPFKNTSLI